MSVSDKKYWSQRVQELANSVKPVSDTDFFSSDAYREFTENAAKDMISGVCGYLRSIGYKISEKEESERVDELTVVMLADANMTACTTGDTVLIGVDGDLVNYFDSRELRHYAIQGLRVHEMGHVLFTNFQNMKMWHDKLSKGIWWPEKPQRVSTPEGTELTDIMQKPEYVSSFVSIAKNIENSIEDGFIEREIRSMYGGLASTELATINDALISKSLSFGETLKKSSPFEAMMEQVLLYAKFDFTMTEDMPSEYDDIFDECIELIDDCKYERDSLKRLKGVNELCCALYPLLKDFIKKETKMGQSAGGGDSGSPSGGMGNSGPSGQNGSSGDKSQSQNGNSNNQQSQNGNNSSQQGQNDSIQNIPQSVLQKALQKAAKAAQKAANRAGATKEGDRDSQSITDKGARSKEAKDYSNGKQAASESDTGRTDHNNVSHEKGFSIGQPDLGAATMDLKSIENQRKIEAATEQANEELNAQLKKEAAEMRKTVGTRLEVTRAEKVSDSNVATYKRLSSDLLGVTKNLERRLKTVIRDEENDDAVAGLPMGSRVEARLAYHQDGKIFSRKNFPRDNPRLAVGYLCDESGSMSGSAIQASVRTGIIIQDLCERMELPCYICGYTTASNYGGTQILEYVDQDIDGKDKYRITGMASRGGTPTMPAMRYMGEKLRREQAEKRLLIVSTDGCSDGGRESIQQVIKDLRKKYNIIVIGAGIGASRGSVENEFGDNFIDISNLETMPRVLCNIVKKNLL